MPHRFDPRPAAQAFWRSAATPRAFPCELRPAIAEVLPVAVIGLPRLTLASAAEWLRSRGASCFRYTADRALCGCLVAQRGHGFIFLDSTLPAEEERLTLAHETAHFVHHYRGPRDAALAALGAAIRPVLDGDRVPTSAEILSGVIRGVRIGTYHHAIERFDDGLPDATTLRLETEADLIGLELLAPSDRVAATTPPGEPRREALCRTYGLPSSAATAWAGWIDAHRAPDALIARLEDHRQKNRA